MKRRAGNLLALVLGLAGALLAAEAGVRIFWSGAPAAFGHSESLPLQRVRDPEIIYRLAPNATGFYNGTPFELNSLGLRDRDYRSAPPPGAHRILVLGDSLVFGIGLPADQTLSAKLARRLDRVEVINGGVFGYNLDQEIRLLADIGPVYRPDLVVAAFCHNDIDNWGLGDGGAVPEIKSTRFDPPPAGALSTRLAGMMLPDGFDADRLNLLPGAGGGPRHWLATHSRLYLFAYLRLRLHSWNMTTGERRNPLVGLPTCQAEEIIWEPLRRRYRRLRSVAESSGASLAVVIHNALVWEGLPLQRLGEILSEESIPFLDMTPVWLEPDRYAREYSLGWDPHPNARANDVTADLVASFIHEAGLMPGQERSTVALAATGAEEVIATRPELRGGLEEFRRLQARLVRADERHWEELTARLEEAVALPPAGRTGEQVLYGFWEEGGDRPLPAPVDDAGRPVNGLWMSRQASVLLARRPGASRVTVDLVTPPGWETSTPAPRSLRIALSIPPESCLVHEDEIPLPAEIQVGASGSGRFRLAAALPPGLPEGAVLEVRLSVDRAMPATYLAPYGSDAGGSPDHRLVSFFIRRVGLE